MPPLAETLDAIRRLVGPKGWVEGDAIEPYSEERGLYRGSAFAVVRPASAAEVAGVVRLCAGASIPIVPQGGNTGLVGGGVMPSNVP